MFDITTNALQTVRYLMPGAVAVRYLARYRTAIPQGNWYRTAKTNVLEQ